MRCMGKNTTAGVKGSPSRTMIARSSKEASSAPLMLSPSPARASIMPQNFSRGLHNVTMTMAPGAKGDSTLSLGLREDLSTQRLSLGSLIDCNLHDRSIQGCVARALRPATAGGTNRPRNYGPCWQGSLIFVVLVRVADRSVRATHSRATCLPESPAGL